MEAYGCDRGQQGDWRAISCRDCAGGWYQFTQRIAVTFALLGGSHIASPKIGGQFGFEMDFPLRHAASASHATE